VLGNITQCGRWLRCSWWAMTPPMPDFDDRTLAQCKAEARRYERLAKAVADETLAASFRSLAVEARARARLLR